MDFGAVMRASFLVLGNGFRPLRWFNSTPTIAPIRILLMSLIVLSRLLIKIIVRKVNRQKVLVEGLGLPDWKQ